MVCPNCGARVEAGARFCAECGAHMPEAPAAQVLNPVQASVPPAPTPAPASSQPAAQPVPAAQPIPTPPSWSQPIAPAAPFTAAPVPPAPSPAAPTPPPWGQPATPPPPPNWAAPQARPPQPPQPQYGVPYQPPQQPQYQYPPQGFAAAPAVPVAATPAAATKPNVFAGLLALAGGAVAVGSAWLPWWNSPVVTLKAVDFTSFNDIANGYCLIAGGAVAAVCGLVLFLGLVRASSATTLVGLLALAAGAFTIAVDAVAYSHIPDASLVGMGIYAGAAGGGAAVLGGLLALAKRN